VAEHSLLFEATIYLAAAVVCVPLASRLRLGSVLGYLAAGCAIGPFGLHLIGDVQSSLHFAEFGVVLMLFLIGLELDPARLWSLRRPVFGGGSLQMVVSGVVIGAAALGLGLGWQAAIVTGLALALSSTAIAVQTMRERGVLSSPLGNTAFSILLFQDVAAIPLIALVPLLAGGRAEGSGVMGLVKVLGAIAAVIVLGRYVTTPVMRLIARTGLREVFTGFALLLVLGIAQIMASAGVSMALGAFLAGVLLAGSEYRHALEADIEPFKGLLMGLFFIAVGMSIDFALLENQPLLIAALVVGLLVLKGGALAALSGALGVSAKQRWTLAALLSQGGEFAFVVFGVAGQAKLLPGNWDAILTLVVALSMGLTPISLLVHDRLVIKEDRKNPPADAIEHEGARVIIAGFGRFGQIIGRLLLATGVRVTLLDHDPDQIELLKKFNFRVFFGDASRLDLLHAAGAEHAKVFVVALDDIAASTRLVDLLREHFPRAKIVARARNITHYLALRERGVIDVERETFESALKAGRRALEQLGIGAYKAREAADRFRRHNVATLEALLPHLSDEAQRLSVARAAREQFEQQLSRDFADLKEDSAEWTSGEPVESDERAPAS
jgi:glutathione-regulated potassium-efflux system ancillary protein KefC